CPFLVESYPASAHLPLMILITFGLPGLYYKIGKNVKSVKQRICNTFQCLANLIDLDTALMNS
ncbi:MAG: hypothetical protein ACE5DO_09290, partial [Desulfobacterales bacterium]